MVKNLDFDGDLKFIRDRTLVEEGSTISSYLKQDKPPVSKDILDERQEAVDELFTDIGKTLIKSTIVKNGLSKMNPAQEIPISQDSSNTVVAARRLDEVQSKAGTVITYSMFQNAVDTLFDINWKLKVRFLNSKAPVSTFDSSNTQTTSRSGSEAENLIKEFLKENGIAGTIINMLTLAPFQSVIFQTLTVEEGAKAIQTLQVPAGIALLIELGVKAEQIIQFLKKSKLRPALTEAQITSLEANTIERANALAEFGIDYTDLKDSLIEQDSQEIVDYVIDFNARNGGLVSRNSHLTIDHWIGYLETSRIQQTLRSAINTADTYSQKFQNIRQGVKDYNVNRPDEPLPPRVKIHIDLASTLRSLDSYSNTQLEEIVDAFNHQISDRAYCCLVEIFGYPGDSAVNTMQSIAYILRILATDLAANLTTIADIGRRFIARKLQSAAFDIIAQLNTLYDKIQDKLVKAFTIEIPGLENCGGMLILGQALSLSVETINRQMNALIRDVIGMLGEFSMPSSGTWRISAERRELLGIARVLEALSLKLSLAKTCSKNRDTLNVSESVSDIKEEAARNIITEIISNPEPSIQISDTDYSKYFKESITKTSPNLNIRYGIKAIQEDMIENVNCNELTQEQSVSIAEKFWTNFKTVIKND